MAITPAVELADWASGIGTGPLQIDNVVDRVGIGTTAPLALLDVSMSDPTPSGSGITTALLIRHTAGQFHALRVEDESHPDVTPFIVNVNGRVAIGTDDTDGNELSIVRANPSILLKATKGNNSGVFIFEGKDDAGIAVTTEINSRNTSALDVNLDVYGTNTESEVEQYRKLRLRTSSETKVVVTGIGSVGIGTENPDSLLHVHTANNAGNIPLLRLSASTMRTNYVGVNLSDNLVLAADDDNEGNDSSMRFRVDGTERVRILDTGHVGIATVTPDHSLHIYKDNATLAVFEREGIHNATIQFMKSNSGDAGRSSMFLGLSGNDAFGINDAVDLDNTPLFQLNRTGIASAFAFTSSNDNDNNVDGTCAINLTATQGAIAMDTEGSTIGTKRITWNDGGGNLNLRLNNNYDDTAGGEQFLVTNDGAANITMNAESADGTIEFNVAVQGTAGNDISWIPLIWSTGGALTGDHPSGIQFVGRRDDQSVTDGNNIVMMRGYSNEGNTYHDVGRISLRGSAGHTSTSKPTEWVFFNCPTASTTDREVMELQQDGDLLLKATGLSGTGGANGQRGFKMNTGGTKMEVGLHQTTDDNPLAFILLEAEDGALRYYWTSNANKLMINSALPATSSDTASGTVVGDQSSDERLKENIIDLPYGLAEIKQLRPRRFEMKNVWDTRVYSGFVAQETQSIIPESVYSTEEDAEDGTDNKLLAMSYVDLIAPLVNAVKELSTKNDQLEARIATLEGA